MKIGEKDIYAYGETPLTTMQQIAKSCAINSNDTFFELGSGRGRCCFWLKCFIGCKVVGIEFVPEFVERANKIVTCFELQQIEFHKIDMLKADFTGGTLFYLYGTCYDTPFIKKMIEKVRNLPKGTKFVTVSYALSTYSDEDLFMIEKTFQADFTWGSADVYLQTLK